MVVGNLTKKGLRAAFQSTNMATLKLPLRQREFIQNNGRIVWGNVKLPGKFSRRIYIVFNGLTEKSRTIYSAGKLFYAIKQRTIGHLYDRARTVMVANLSLTSR